jgi:hypothetical protein
MVGPRVNLHGPHLDRLRALTGSSLSGHSFPDSPLGRIGVRLDGDPLGQRLVDPTRRRTRRRSQIAATAPVDEGACIGRIVQDRIDSCLACWLPAGLAGPGAPVCRRAAASPCRAGGAAPSGTSRGSRSGPGPTRSSAAPAGRVFDPPTVCQPNQAVGSCWR